MEHDIRHNDVKNNAKTKNATNNDPLSYLGPFNFRQLLRPIQGPTNSLRKRNITNMVAVKPCAL